MIVVLGIAVKREVISVLIRSSAPRIALFWRASFVPALFCLAVSIQRCWAGVKLGVVVGKEGTVILDQNNIRLHVDGSRRGVGDLVDRVAKVAFVLLRQKISSG
jgi:hypothetical protein